MQIAGAEIVIRVIFRGVHYDWRYSTKASRRFPVFLLDMLRGLVFASLDNTDNDVCSDGEMFDLGSTGNIALLNEN